MGIKCGIVGLPNVGKSTLFNALTGSSVGAENYPFTTVDPNVGVVAMRDERLDRIAEIAGTAETVPASIEFVDIAGLVKGASEGEGLGNQFLARIREVDAIAHVVRCFEDPDIAHVHGTVDPVADAEVVEAELILADIATVERALEREGRRARAGDRDARQVVSAYEAAHALLSRGHPAASLASDQRRHLADLFLLTAIPMLFVANIAEPGDEGTGEVAALRAHAADRGARVVALAAGLEAEITQLAPEDRQVFLDDLGLERSGLEVLTAAAYETLELHTFFTATGGREARAWPFRAGTTAAEAAGLIHGDFERGFVRAEVVDYEDYVALAGEHGARDAGKLRVEGRDHPVVDGEVIRFRYNL